MARVPVFWTPRLHMQRHFWVKELFPVWNDSMLHSFQHVDFCQHDPKRSFGRQEHYRHIHSYFCNHPDLPGFEFGYSCYHLTSLALTLEENELLQNLESEDFVSVSVGPLSVF